MCSLRNYGLPPASTLSFDGSNKDGFDNLPGWLPGRCQVKQKFGFVQDFENRDWVNSQEKG